MAGVLFAVAGLQTEPLFRPQVSNPDAASARVRMGKPMRFVVDESIPYGPEAFATLGEVTALPGREIRNADFREADVLIIRTVTRPNAELLDGTPVRFVGTCTIGEDHVDLAYLRKTGIGFSSAPGCNANSVAEYMTAAWLELEYRGLLCVKGSTLGIVGYGNVGKRVAEKARILGMNVVLHDPPLEQTGFDAEFRSIDAIHGCDLVTFHVPLTRDGDHPTYHYADERFLSDMKPGAMVFNTSRGPVVDNAALLNALQSGHCGGAVLDVWEHEPNLAQALVDSVTLASPHIAGYSIDGKLNATQQIYDVTCRHFGLEPAWSSDDVGLTPPEPQLDIESEDPHPLLRAVRHNYDIRKDDANVRVLFNLPESERANAFEQLRKTYRRRFEFRHTTLSGAGSTATFEQLGFQVSHA